MSSKLTGIKIKNDYSKMIIDLMNNKVETALEAIGATAERYAKEECPVDSGRLRNSITWATAENQGEGKSPASAKDYTAQAKPLNKFVYIGTNVEYAPYVEYNEKARHDPPEFGGGKAHFLRDAAVNHTDHYKEIMRSALDS